MSWMFSGLTLPKDATRPEACEDRVVMLPPDFAAVIDGATDINGQLFDGKTGGVLAAETLAAAFAAAWPTARRGGNDPFATAADAVELANNALAALYGELGIADLATNPARRFRAAFAIASCRNGVWRGVGVGDCSLRINDGPALSRDHPAETLFAAWRSEMITEMPDRCEAEIRNALLAGLSGADQAARRAAARVRSNDPDLRGLVLTAGLTGMRSALPGDRLAFGVADGVGDMGADFCWQVAAPAHQVRSLALWSDGWLVPGGNRLEDWLACQAAAHAADPRRIGRYARIKGPSSCGRHDDMGLALLIPAE